MGAPLHVWARLALLALLLGTAGLAAIGAPAIFAIDPRRRGRHVRHSPGARFIGRARVMCAPMPLPPYMTGVRMHTFATTPGVVHLSTCQSLRGRALVPWPWADGRTYVEIKAAMKAAHTTGCARCKPLTVRSR